MRCLSLVRICLCIIGLALAGTAPLLAAEPVKYDAASFAAAQSAGKSVLVHVTAPWCPTCKAQHQALKGLIGKPEFADLAIFDVDFDSQIDVVKSFKARSQSTMIAFNGSKETGRIVGDANPASIEALMKSALAK
jgi:thiol-disulfide isomerase/thioredoxin